MGAAAFSLRPPRLPVAVATVVAIGLVGCTSGHPGGNAGVPRRAVPAGAAVLTLAGHAYRLPIQRCIGSDEHHLNLTAYDVKTKATLVVNVAEPLGASTLVYTTRDADNAFTNYALAATVGHSPITGRVAGRQISLTGNASRQSFRPDGTASGTASSEPVSLDASCQKINPPHPAPSYHVQTSTAKEAGPRPHGSPTR
jgi:hypothetical protein